MIKLDGEDAEVRTSNQTRQGPEKVEEHSSAHLGEEDDESDPAEQQQDGMEATSDVWSVWELYLSTSCAGTTQI